MSVSVVIPVRNKARTIARAVVSAAVQSPAEVVVIDDASTDDTAEIVERLAGKLGCIRLVRNAAKADDWQQAAAAVYESLSGSHVVCMGGDDALCDGMIAGVNQHADAAIVFRDYFVANTSDEVTGGVWMGYKEPAVLSAEDVRQRVLTYPYASETGIGSGIRRDLLLWLASCEFWRMGPWSDAIGYCVAAALHGCVFKPGAGAMFTIDDAGYGAIGRDGPDAGRYHQAVREFVNQQPLPDGVKRMVCEKRGVPYG